MKKKLVEGFTLIELMIVIVIIGILAAIAYPAYVDQVRKSRRADCAGVLTGLAAAMERNFTENNTYLALGSAGATGAPISTLYANKCPISPIGVKYYDLDITAATATTYTISAIPVPGSDQANDKCKTLTLTNTGIKGITGTGTVSRCW